MPWGACGSLDVHDLAAEALDQLQRLVEGAPDALLDALGARAELRRHAEAQALQVGAARRAHVLGQTRAKWSRRGRARRGAVSSSAASVTVRVSGPHWSSDDANATIP